MKRELQQAYEKELIVEIACCADGIGKIKAASVAEYFGDLQRFLSAKEADFQKHVSATKKRIVHDDAISKIMSEKAKVVQGKSIAITWIHFLARRFIEVQANKVSKLSFEGLPINPLLTKALDLKTAAEIITFNLYQHIGRSVVTSWGTYVEDMLKYSGCEVDTSKIGERGNEPDLTKVLGEQSYHIQVKSGPDDMNLGMVLRLDEVIDRVEAKGGKMMLGITYGKKPSTIISGNMKKPDDRIKTGRQLWDFVSEETEFHKIVIATIDEATKAVLKTSFIKSIEEKIQVFCEEWQKKYGNKPLDQVLSEEYI